ncbi:unnamed protein product [Gongylonema pulchrum]|uniref:Uncharacterized protein n=1 Tax=Gongylonema pulchrum TaxID=637853 RepID=A0A183DHE6_9BILA|nr:unnamed protein product [Gongylonema pulchrum]
MARASDGQMVAIIGGVVSAYLAVEEILTVHFTPPCYLRAVLPQTSHHDVFHGEKINCCGVGQNIYVGGNATEMCRTPEDILM